MKISWHGHSCVIIETNNNDKIIIDPFIRDNPLSDLDSETLNVDYILLTHAHNDHVGDTFDLAKRNDALVIAPVELADFLKNKGLKTHGMNIGGQYQFSFGTLKLFPAFHSSNLTWNDESFNLGNPSSMLISFDDVTVYHAGDTALYSDMSLIGPVDLAFLPIGDNFTMGIDDAVKAATFLQAKNAVPTHYNTFPIIEQDPLKFINKLKKTHGILPNIGESIII